MNARALIACLECDALQRVPREPDDSPNVSSNGFPNGSVCCWRCGAQLHRLGRYDLSGPLSLALTALTLLVIANANPIVAFEMRGTSVTTTLWHAVSMLWRDDVQPVAALVFITVFVSPVIQIAVMLYVLLPLQFGRVPPYVELPLRVFRVAQPWGMVEVFILGILISLVKLSHMAHVIPGIALWAFAILVVVFAALSSVFDPVRLWARIERLS